MAMRTINTRIALDGEAEFKKQMSQVNGELKTLKSEMSLVTAEFQDNADSVEGLTKKSEILRKEVDQQGEKVRALEQALSDSIEVYGEADSKTDKYRQSVNKAKEELIKMTRELKETDTRLEEARKSAEDADKAFDDLADSLGDARDGADKTGGALDGLGGKFGGGASIIDDFSGKLSGLGVAGVAGIAVAGLSKVAGAIADVVDETKEFRKIMGTMEVSSEKAGYTAEETAEAYNYLYGVLGDEQSAATTLANLQAIGLEQDELLGLIDALVGAWASYGDSIPIDGLAEAINETIKVGQVTGTFADVLNWAGKSEDTMNRELGRMVHESERVYEVMDMLNRLALPETGKQWREVNEDIVATNEATLKLEASTARLGETLTPVQAKITEFKASAIDAANWALSTIFAGGTGEGNGGAASAEIAAAKAEQAQAKWNKSSGTVFNSHVGSGGGVLSGAFPGNSAAQQPQEIVLNVTETIDGAVLARNQYRYNTREGTLRGGSLVEVGK